MENVRVLLSSLEQPDHVNTWRMKDWETLWILKEELIREDQKDLVDTHTGQLLVTLVNGRKETLWNRNLRQFIVRSVGKNVLKLIVNHVLIVTREFVTGVFIGEDKKTFTS